MKKPIDGTLAERKAWYGRLQRQRAQRRHRQAQPANIETEDEPTQPRSRVSYSDMRRAFGF